MMQRFIISAAMFLLLPIVTLGAEEEPRAIVERAIKAQGGEEQVAKLTKAWRAKVKGTRGKLSNTGEMLYQAPGQMRIATSIEVGDVKIPIIAVLNGDKGWQHINGQTREVTGKELEEMKDGAYRSREVRFLLPLVKEPGFTFSLLPDQEVSERPATGIRVQKKGHRDIDLYFDKENGLLVKTESRILNPEKKELVLEQIFSEYKDFDGVKLATKFTKYENGKLQSIEEITEMTFVDQIDAQEFAKP
jgi:hypothetical protein